MFKKFRPIKIFNLKGKKRYILKYKSNYNNFERYYIIYYILHNILQLYLILIVFSREINICLHKVLLST